MQQKKILVPLGSNDRGLKGIHYALALAERVQARIYILRQTVCPGLGNPISTWLDEALADLVNNARQAGLAVSYYIADKDLKNEILSLIRSESIDLVVISTDDRACRRILLQLKPLIPSQIIQVREKDHAHYLR